MRPGTPGFVGYRLREAREARGMTAIALADILGITRAAVSQYENGHQSPSPEIMRQVSHVLNSPVQRFLRPADSSRDRGVIFYRCMSSATKRARSRAERRYEWLREISCFLEKYARFPDVQFPQFELPDNPEQLDHDRIDDLATEARRFWGLGDGPISNVTWLLENNGAIMCRCELEAATLDAFSEWHPSDRRPFIILASDKDSAARSKFDAAHELGHMLLHRKVMPSLLNHNSSFSLLEAQANRFASSFLLPSASFGNEFYAPSLDALRSLKERWGISIAAMIMRAADLRLVTEDQQKKMWINLARRKWKTREPLDDIVEPERPRFLRRCLELLLEKRVISAQEISFQLGISASDIERLIGLEPGRLSGHQLPVEIVGDNPLDDDSGQIIRFPRTA